MVRSNGFPICVVFWMLKISKYVLCEQPKSLENCAVAFQVTITSVSQVSSNLEYHPFSRILFTWKHCSVKINGSCVIITIHETETISIRPRSRSLFENFVAQLEFLPNRCYLIEFDPRILMLFVRH